MEITWLSLLPPSIAVISAAITKRINTSLFAGIVAACLIGTSFAPVASAKLLISSVLEKLTDPDNLYLYAFLCTIGILITLLNHIGAAAAFAHRAAERLKTIKGVERFSLLLSFLLTIDDYLSILTVGYVMRPLTDRFGIARLKLAFLVHSVATPLIIIVPYASWVPVTTAYLESPNYIAAESLLTYLMTIPFIFCSFLALASVIFLVARGISFGPLVPKDEDAAETPPETSQPDTHPNSTLTDLILPIAILVSGLLFGIPLTGGYYLFGGTRSLMQSIQYNEYSLLTMLLSVSLALIVGLSRAVVKKQLASKEIPLIVRSGILLMASAVLMVFLASVLNLLLTNNVMTGEYLASQFLGSIPLQFLPVMFFFTSLACSMAIGSAWATFGLLPPIAIPMTMELLQVSLPATLTNAPLILPVLGAILAGAICGNHLSPLSETTMLTATSTGCTPLSHAYSQFIYMVPAIVGTVAAFLLSGIFMQSGILVSIMLSMGVGLALCLGILELLNRTGAKK